MQINPLKLYLLILVIAIVQLIINSSTLLYLDIIGMVLVVILVNGIYSLRMLVAIGLFADLIGHWYLGTHLVATILISFLTSSMLNFYRMSSSIQKIIIVGVFYSLLSLIDGLIGLLTHNSNFHLLNYIVELIVLTPIVLWLFNRFIIKISADIII